MQIECQGLFNNSQQPAPAALDNSFAVAAVLGRVCRAWHLTSEVQVLVPGIRRAEG